MCISRRTHRDSVRGFTLRSQRKRRGARANSQPCTSTRVCTNAQTHSCVSIEMFCGNHVCACALRCMQITTHVFSIFSHSIYGSGGFHIGRSLLLWVFLYLYVRTICILHYSRFHSAHLYNYSSVINKCEFVVCISWYLLSQLISKARLHCCASPSLLFIINDNHSLFRIPKCPYCAPSLHAHMRTRKVNTM